MAVNKQNGAMLNAAQSNPRRAEALALIRSGQIGECESWFTAPKATPVQKARELARRVLRRIRK